MYGECGGAKFYAKTLYHYWAANYASGDDFNPVKQGVSGYRVKGGYFLRGVRSWTLSKFWRLHSKFW